MTHQARQPWSPCRRHLFELFEAFPPRFRDRAFWMIDEHVWELIKADDDMVTDWFDGVGTGTHFYRRSLLGQPVQLTQDDAITVQIVLPVECPRGRAS